jgi:hypothetical protein
LENLTAIIEAILFVAGDPVRVDVLEVNGKRYPNRLAALSPSPLAGGCQAIIGTEEGGYL